jgi:AcrR family transcriptional regulator
LAYHHGNLRSVLLEKAAEVVEERGAAALSLREVARRAGVSHGAPARHFADKAALLTALAAESTRSYHAALVEALREAGDGGLERVRAIAITYVRFAIERPRALRLASQSDLFDTADAAFAEAEREVFDLILDAVAEAQREGWASDMDPATVLITIWSTVHGLAMLWLEGRIERRLGPLDLETLIEQVVGFTTDAGGRASSTR